MRKTTTLAVLVSGLALLTLGHPMNAPAAQDSKAEQEVLKVNKEYDEAIVRGDVAAYERILADEYTFTSAEGNVASKAQEIARVKAGELKFHSGQSDDVKVRIYGDTAVMTGRWTWKGERKGQPVSGVERYTAVFVRRDGRWQLVAEHGSNVPQK